jgi:hypothetical protein
MSKNHCKAIYKKGKYGGQICNQSCRGEYCFNHGSAKKKAEKKAYERRKQKNLEQQTIKNKIQYYADENNYKPLNNKDLKDVEEIEKNDPYKKTYVEPKKAYVTIVKPEIDNYENYLQENPSKENYNHSLINKNNESKQYYIHNFLLKSCQARQIDNQTVDSISSIKLGSNVAYINKDDLLRLGGKLTFIDKQNEYIRIRNYQQKIVFTVQLKDIRTLFVYNNKCYQNNEVQKENNEFKIPITTKKPTPSCNIPVKIGDYVLNYVKDQYAYNRAINTEKYKTLKSKYEAYIQNQ